ncbi:MAG: RNase P modulator RnpM [Christensenellaceae bacterium]|jgi:predicted RNA-binding protein YlxR (DUF448 family)
MAKTRKTPVRMCVACREGKPKRDLIRVVKNKEGEISIDTTGKAQGRGAYICPDLACLEKAYKIKALHRALETEIDEETFEGLKRVILRREIIG